MFDTIKNHPVFIAENNIAVFSHQFDNKIFLTWIAKFIQMFQLKFYNTLQARLRYTSNSRTAQMLAKKHTKIGCCQWTWFIFAGKINKWKRGTGGYK